jgi:diguanylate cyclase (GGDEF)-like protein
VARIVSQVLGFATVAINMYRPDTEDYETVTVHGNTGAREILLGSVTTADTWTPLLDRRFLRHGVYFIPDGALELDLEQKWYTPDLPRAAVEAERAWRADDALLATLEGFGGRRYGVISVDEPESGLRPDDQQLELLDALVTHAGLAIDSARHLAALESALEQSRALFYGFIRDISERRRGEEQLAYLAYHDPLTGLPNRILVEQQLDLALARARRTEGAVALMFVDLDDFKEVNDRLGHAAGDRLLAGVAARLRSVLRDSDLLARQGGDEFLVLVADLTEDPAPSAEHVGGNLLSALREPFVVAGTEVRTGASIGVSLYPDDADDTEALLRHSDVAMYQAKTAGGGRLVFHERSEAGLSRRASLSAQLRRAMAQRELELHYQPVWCLEARGAITGVEALLRWRHPTADCSGWRRSSTSSSRAAPAKN